MLAVLRMKETLFFSFPASVFHLIKLVVEFNLCPVEPLSDSLSPGEVARITGRHSHHCTRG